MSTLQPGGQALPELPRLFRLWIRVALRKCVMVTQFGIKREDSGLLRAFSLLTGTVALDRETVSHIHSTTESAFGHKVTLSTTSWCPLFENQWPSPEWGPR